MKPLGAWTLPTQPWRRHQISGAREEVVSRGGKSVHGTSMGKDPRELPHDPHMETQQARHRRAALRTPGGLWPCCPVGKGSWEPLPAPEDCYHPQFIHQTPRRPVQNFFPETFLDWNNAVASLRNTARHFQPGQLVSSPSYLAYTLAITAKAVCSQGHWGPGLQNPYHQDPHIRHAAARLPSIHTLAHTRSWLGHTLLEK